MSFGTSSKVEEIENLTLNHCILGAKFGMQLYKNGGICTFIQDNITFSNINLNEYTKEKDFETCSMKINSLTHYKIVMTIYRYPTGDFSYFLNSLESTSNIIYNSTTTLLYVEI